MRIWKACEIVKDLKDKVWCGTDDLETTIRISNEKEALDTVLRYCLDTIDLYEAWARENGKHVCAACKRNADNIANGTRCPIQEHYTLPKDGFCHLWEGQDAQKEDGLNEELDESTEGQATEGREG